MGRSPTSRGHHASTDPVCAPGHCPIGPAGRLARLVVGVTFIGLAFFWREPDWGDFVLGLVFAPAVVTALLAWRAHRTPAPLRATGLFGHVANLALLIPLFAWSVTAGAAFLFYGASMLLAATRGNGACEVTAISNAVLGRDDELGCPLFWPIDAAEARIERGTERPAEGRQLKVELLYFDGCPNHESLLPRLRELVSEADPAAKVELRRVESPDEAERERFLGSPTVRVDERDVDPTAEERRDFGFKCRLYRSDSGLSGLPPEEWIRTALAKPSPQPSPELPTAHRK